MKYSYRNSVRHWGPLHQGLNELTQRHEWVGKAFSLRKLLQGPYSIKISLESISCINTEDFFGDDELEMDIYQDGEFARKLSSNINDGEHFSFEATGSIRANSKIAVHIYDKDTAGTDGDDLLGDFIIHSKDIRHPYRTTQTFSRDGAEYRISYKVLPEIFFQESARDILAAFRSRNKTPLWNRINKNDVIQQLEDRLQSPFLINQGPTYFCGPAAVLFEFARHMPKRYVKMMISLYETGKWEAKDVTIIAPESIMGEAVFSHTYEDGRRSSIPEVDWIALTSLKNSHENINFTIDEPNDARSSYQAGTLAVQTAFHTTCLLGWRNPDVFTTTQFGHLGFRIGGVGILSLGLLNLTEFVFQELTGDAVEGLKEAKRTLNKGGLALMQINSDLLDFQIDDAEGITDNPADASVFYPLLPNISSHFISLYDNSANITHDDRVRIEVYTWGDTRLIDISTRDFETEMFAYVLAYPEASI